MQQLNAIFVVIYTVKIVYETSYHIPLLLVFFLLIVVFTYSAH